MMTEEILETHLVRVCQYAYQSLQVLCLHDLDYLDHVDGVYGENALDLQYDPLHYFLAQVSCRQLGMVDKNHPQDSVSRSCAENGCC